MSKNKKLKIIISIVCISFVQGLQFSVSPILEQIQKNYSYVSVNMVQMLITAPALLAMLISIMSGWLVLKVSKKKLLVFGSMIAGVTGFLPFLSDSFEFLFFSRTFYGVGLGLATALNTAVVAEFFEGDERVSVMGIQAASIGAGMVIITTISGKLGSLGFQHAYYVNVIAFISMILIALLLPDTGKAEIINSEKIKLNKDVFKISLLGMLVFLFIITFTTNISMHISGDLAGNSNVSGILTGVFSASQIIVGVILGNITRITKRFTLPVSIISFSIGGTLLVLFPSSYIFLIVGAIFCGFAQGIFVPQAMVEITNSVKPVATAMASAVFTSAICMGQVISPTVLNTTSSIIFGNVSTVNVYIIAVIGSAAVALTVASTKLIKHK